MFAYCVSAAYQEAASVRVTGARVVRHVERPRVRSKNVSIAEPAPELQPMCCARLAPRAERSAWSWTVYPREVVRPPAEPAPLLSKRAVDRWSRKADRGSRQGL